MRCTSSSAETCRVREPWFLPSVYRMSSTSTAGMSRSDSIAASASFAVATPLKVMPRGLSRLRAAAFSPLTNSRNTRCSSLMTRMRVTGFAIGGRKYNPACGAPDDASLRHCLDGLGEAALLARRGIAVQDALGGDAVDDAARLLQRGRGGGLGSAGHALLYLLHRAGHLGAQ